MKCARVPTRVLAVLVGCMLARASGPLLGQEARPSPRFQGSIIPVPPRQKLPWQAPRSELPDAVGAAAAALFEQGLADPRGCEYREIQVVIGEPWRGDGGVFRTHGWVLPAGSYQGLTRAEEHLQFAVCWNGLTYPIVAAGNKADLRADVLRAVESAIKLRAAGPEARFGLDLYADQEASTIAVGPVSPIRACLLLRLGESELGQRVWKLSASEELGASDWRKLHVLLARDWTWSLFNRAVCAQMRGDDRLALLSLRVLGPVAAAIDAEAARQGLHRLDDLLRAQKPQGYLEFVDQLPVLLADQERRARESNRVPPRDVSHIPEADKARRIAWLIENLDQIAVRQMMQPGGISLGYDWRVRAVAAEGDDAVEPLLQCLEHDTRLTRSVSFWRDFSRNRRVHGVAEAALDALTELLETSHFGPVTEHPGARGDEAETRAKVAAEIRAYWKRFRGVPLEERWYRILADDLASHEQWLAAAQRIVEPRDSRGQSEFYRFESLPWIREFRRPCRGEALRAKHAPTVSELLARRAQSVARSGPRDPSDRVNAARKATPLVILAARWDIAAAEPVLHEHESRCRALSARSRATEPNVVQSGLESDIAQIVLARIRCGAPGALDAYARWIRSLRTIPEEDFLPILEPLWSNSDHPAIAGACDWLFNDPASPWRSVVTDRGTRISIHDNVIKSQLLGIAPFRRKVLSELADHSPCGTVSRRDQDSLEIKSVGGTSGIGGYRFVAPLPEVGARTAFRTCDYLANTLSGLEGFPRAELYWPEQRRDAAVARSIEFLTRYGECFKARASEGDRENGSWGQIEGDARLHFPRLDHPASPEDARQGLAIFSLAEEGPRRPAEMPPLPLRARWVTFKEYRVLSSFTEPFLGMSVPRWEYLQEGTVWQAEEVLRDGAWCRYYGFVGPNGPARVPAAEIEFTADDRWIRLGPYLDCLLVPPGATLEDDGRGEPSVPIGTPLCVTLWLRNRHGAQTQPAEVDIYRKSPMGEVALRTNTGLQLAFAPAELRADPVESAEPVWRELIPKAQGRFTSEAPPAWVLPAVPFKVFSLDLLDWFQPSGPGVYRVRLALPAQGSGSRESIFVETRFRLMDPKFETAQTKIH